MSEESEYLIPIREAIIEAMFERGITTDEVMETVKDQIYWVENFLNKRVLNLDTGDVSRLKDVLPTKN